MVVDLETLIEETPLIGFINIPNYFDKVNKRTDLKDYEKKILKTYYLTKQTTYLIGLAYVMSYFKK